MINLFKVWFAALTLPLAQPAGAAVLLPFVSFQDLAQFPPTPIIWVDPSLPLLLLGSPVLKRFSALEGFVDQFILN